MIWAVLFFLTFCVAVICGIVLVARGRSGVRITDPVVRSVDYDNPYGRGVYFWTGRRAPQSAPPGPPAASGPADTWPGFAPITTPLTFRRAAEPATAPSPTPPTERSTTSPRTSPTEPGPLPAQVSLDDGYRAAYYLVEQYAALEPDPDGSLAHLLEYLRGHPARRDEWAQAVRNALNPGRADDPLADGVPRRE